MQSDLGILSAEQFDIGVPLPSVRRTRTGPRRQPLNGQPLRSSQPELLPFERPGADVAGPEPAGRAAKRAKMGAAECEDGEEDADKKRSRGRPRIDAKDVTAADRRRTQIRLAQRAYRSRKEKAISTLERKVQSLQEANEAMSNAFVRLHDAAITCGLVDQHPEFALQLRSTTETFLDMARQSSGDEEAAGDDNDDDEVNGDSAASTALTAPRVPGAPTASTVPVTAAGSHWLDRKQRRIAEAVATFGYNTRRRSSSAEEVPPKQPRQLYGGLIDNLGSTTSNSNSNSNSYGGLLDSSTAVTTTGFFGNSSTSIMPTASATPDFSDTSSAGGFPFDGATAATTNTTAGTAAFSLLDFPLTHNGQSFATHEDLAAAAAGSPYANHLSVPTPFATFGRRLHRLSIERGYELAVNPERSPALFARAFGFCVMFESLDAIRTRLRNRIDTMPVPPPAPKPPSSWHMPYVTDAATAGSLSPSDSSVSSGPASLSLSYSDSSRGINITDTGSITRTTTNSSTNSIASPATANKSDRLLPTIRITMPGFENTYFDCDGTETYLRERGVTIPPDSERIVVEVDESDFGGGAATDSVGAGVGAGAAGVGVDVGISHTDHTLSAYDEMTDAETTFGFPGYPLNGRKDLTPGGSLEWSAATPRTDPAGVDNGGSSRINSNNKSNSSTAAAAANASDDPFLSALMNGGLFSSHNLPPSSSTMSMNLPRRRLLTLDVNRFVNELVQRGTCLVQTPAFRPDDVNEAFWLAVQSATVA